ncbi:type IV secretion system protein VirB7 [Wolbachia endosymbiont of Litomosoides sigmodontis]|uniref:type IV secretion system protein VirB7 n=1 Tax=Wolbachia endosymbiont of Litomosoides sigmodontis TaxID=80850 RepID=UPI00158D37B9|nr:type IV secretion system protein VirB7 [Wolbachia endosymbiont of Litomosoides sigmodontis]QKX03270.1 type IV secretion system protein VirB7 [Wolbachia endosymbiont of Litomosoides sigmodontis]
MFKELLLCILVVFALQGGCSKPRKLKSPCIKGNESTSCELYSVNDHWLGRYKLIAK